MIDTKVVSADRLKTLPIDLVSCQPFGQTQLSGRDWLEWHFSTFVEPNLPAKVPAEMRTTPIKNGYWGGGKNPASCKCVLNKLVEAWARARYNSKGKEIVLLGRDVWEFEILARIEGYPTLFYPQVSSWSYKWFQEVAGKRFENSYLIDSGNKGTIPKALGMKHWQLVYCSLTPGPSPYKLFPEAKGNGHTDGPGGGLYSALEESFKYWMTGECSNNAKKRWIEQKIADWYSYSCAALNTQAIANHALSLGRMSGFSWEFKRHNTKMVGRVV